MTERIIQLSRMTRRQLQEEETKAMERAGMKRIWQAGPMSKDELISSILELEKERGYWQ